MLKCNWLACQDSLSWRSLPVQCGFEGMLGALDHSAFLGMSDIMGLLVPMCHLLTQSHAIPLGIALTPNIGEYGVIITGLVRFFVKPTLCEYYMGWICRRYFIYMVNRGMRSLDLFGRKCQHFVPSHITKSLGR